MALDFSNLTAYTDEVGGMLLKEMIAESRIGSIATIQPGIKGTQSLNLLNIAATLATNSCTFSDTSTSGVSFEQRTITVANIKSEQSLCLQSLEPYWIGQKMRAGSTQDTLVFEQEITELILQDVRRQLETLAFQGDISGSGDLIDGWNTILSADTTKVSTSTGITLSTSTIEAVLDDMILNAPNSVKGKKLVVLASMTDFYYAVAAYRDANLFQYGSFDAENNAITVPGFSNVTIIGLDGQETGKLILTLPENLIIGTDDENEIGVIQAWYAIKENAVLTRTQFKYGVQIGRPELVVCNY